MDSLPRKRPLIFTDCVENAISSPAEILAGEEKISELVKKQIELGADIVSTPTSFANSYKLEKLGISEDCAGINRKIAQITVNATDKKALVAGKISGTDALISPYNEEISFTELMSNYSVQIKALNESVDLFLLDRISSMSDLRAALRSCMKRGKPVIVTVEIDEEEKTSSGLPALCALIVAQETGASAFGIVTDNDETLIKSVKNLAPYAKIPLAARLNSKSDKMCGIFSEASENGVEIIGASFVENISEFSTMSYNFITADVDKQDTSMIFANETQAFFLAPDTTEISEAITCLPDMEDVITETCSKPYDILRVEINTPDDAIDFANNAHMATLPVMFLSHSEIALKMALMLYQGRALIDKETSIPLETTQMLCKKYGAVLY